MTTTETATTATDEETQYIKAADWLQCAVCGVFVTQFAYAHNTCSQQCARTAAIVETINGWQKFITRGMATPYVAMGPVDHSRDVVLDAE